MDNVCEPRRVTVQSIRERFEIQQRQTPPMTRAAEQQQPAEPSSEVDSNHSGSSNASESDHSSTGGGGSGGGGFQQHNRTSIKRSPAFRTGQKESIPENILLKKPALVRTGLKDPNVIIIKNNKKPSLRRKPGVDRTSKPNLSPEPQNLEADPLIEEALKAPLPTGPAPKKPPRTFVHDAFIQQQQQETPKEVGDSDSCSPTRPVRRNKALQQQQQQQQANPAKPSRPTSIALGSPFTMSRSKTEPFLLGRKKSTESEELPAVEDLRRSPLDDVEFDFHESRWLNPVQWNSFSPSPGVTKSSPLKKQQQQQPTSSTRVSTSMLTIADPALLQTGRNGSRHQAGKSLLLAGRHPLHEPTRRMSCDGGRRRPSELTWQQSPTTGLQQRFNSRKEPPVYDQPTLEGGLHYMVRHNILDLFLFIFLFSRRDIFRPYQFLLFRLSCQSIQTTANMQQSNSCDYMEKRKENMILLQQQQHEPGTNTAAIAEKENSRADPSHMGGQSRTNLHCFNHWEKKVKE